MMTMENLESLRQATSDDVSGLIKLLEPLEADGTLVKRPRENLNATSLTSRFLNTTV